MKVIKSKITEVLILEPSQPAKTGAPAKMRETFSVRSMHSCGVDTLFLSENQVRLPYNDMLCGMYYELCPDQQAKLISCQRGSAILGVTDIRADSPNFGQSNVISISEENERSVYLPRGFAFGVLTRSEDVVLQFRFENRWDPEKERVFNALDKETGLQWSSADYIMSSTQRYAPLLFTVRSEVDAIEKKRISEEFERISGGPLVCEEEDEETLEFVEEPLV